MEKIRTYQFKNNLLDIIMYITIWLFFFLLRRIIDKAVNPQIIMFHKWELFIYLFSSLFFSTFPLILSVKKSIHDIGFVINSTLIIGILCSAIFLIINRIGIITSVYSFLYAGIISIDMIREDLFFRSISQSIFMEKLSLWDFISLFVFSFIVIVFVSSVIIIWTYNYDTFMMYVSATLQSFLYAALLILFFLNRSYIRNTGKYLFENSHLEAEAKLFISYSTENESFAHKVINDLRRFGFDSWIDRHQIYVGDRLEDEIKKGIETCDFFILIHSHKVKESIWVKKELDLAFDNKKKIVPLVIDRENIMKELATTHYINFKKDGYRIGFGKLLNTFINNRSNI